MSFMFDNNLSQKIVRGLREFGEDVLHIKDEFPEGILDEDWLPIVGEKQWFVLTRDDRLRTRPLEKSLLKENKVGCFVLAGKNLKAWDLVVQVVRNWARIKEKASTTRRPFVIKVPPTGTQFVEINL